MPKNEFVLTSLLALCLTGFIHCASPAAPEWQEKNEELIKKHDLKIRTISDLPETKIASPLEAAKVSSIDRLDSVQLYPGVHARLFWGSGTMISVLQLAPNAVIPEETLSCDRFVFVLDGSVSQLVNGVRVNMMNIKREAPDGTHGGTPRRDFLYLRKGSKNALTACPSGAKLVEAYSPLRLDYLQKAGVKNLPDQLADVSATLAPNVEPDKVYDLYDIQFTKLAEGSYSRLVSGRNTQMSFISMEPEASFPHHIHPEEQMMLALRGHCEEILLDGQQTMKENSVVRIPSNLVHGAKMGDLGCDAMDVFWPARPDYLEKQKAALSAYHAIIPKNIKAGIAGRWPDNKTRTNLQRGSKMDEWQNLFVEHVFRQGL